MLTRGRSICDKEGGMVAPFRQMFECPQLIGNQTGTVKWQ